MFRQALAVAGADRLLFGTDSSFFPRGWVADVHERQHWKDYMRAYEDAIRETATKHAPWFVVPADHKWFTRLVVAAAVVDALEELELSFPKVNGRQRAELRAARRLLERE